MSETKYMLNIIIIIIIIILILIIIIIIIFISHDKITYPKLQYKLKKKYLHIISKNYSVTKNVLKPVSVDSRDRDWCISKIVPHVLFLM